MKRNKSVVDGRRNKVLEALKNDGTVKVNDLAKKFDVSPLTIRRDLQYLEDNHFLERFYGGAAVVRESSKERVQEDKIQGYREKIAKYAASLVEHGDTIFINTSATALQLIKYLGDKRVTVITNNGQAIGMEHSPNVTIIVTGGEVGAVKHALVGEFAKSNLNMVTAKKSFIGCSGLSLESGMTTEILSEVNINELMFTRVTQESYILADHTKLGVNSSFTSCPLNKIQNVITDEKAPEEIVRGLHSAGINVMCVS
ncbi:ArsR family transcriptional regulator [Sporanaerobium hydrogeniformans]|uniref:ArsR family transcriptional regulator n=1 Tax=Sporanaerobium hydrogeniformans TaxID=3072179 RepID=A0AC61DAS3_9FIRM|nr:DeoR/GlpR family DNA-binding transcription regulator [Sporanaerobium hydrogeniformans]PHV69652.1 ArsR family transcriptional regulator [Sporanaerobium hydrogeniformans]